MVEFEKKKTLSCAWPLSLQMLICKPPKEATDGNEADGMPIVP